VLGGLTLAWGFNWTAMKVALPKCRRGPSAACASASARRCCSSRCAPAGSGWRCRRPVGRLWLLALLNITCWNMLVAFG
jgi:hypothetical protein